MCVVWVLRHGLRHIDQDLDVIVFVVDQRLEPFFDDFVHGHLFRDHGLRFHAAGGDGVDDGFKITEVVRCHWEG